MTNFLLIGTCILAGMLFQRSKTLPIDAHKSLNAWVIYLALPAVSFKYLPHIKWSSELLLPTLSPILIWLGAWVWITLYSKQAKPDKITMGALKLTAGLSNTSFVGFPLVAAYFSESELAIAIICDQITFTLLSTAGIVVAIHSAQKDKLSVPVLLKKVLRFPPFIGCVLALLLPKYIDIDSFIPLFDRLASTVGPIALFSIGLQLRFDGWFHQFRHISMALLYKLILAPSLILLFVLLLQMKGIIAQVTVFEAAMASLVSSGVVADQYGLNSKLANLVIGIGIVLSFITTYFWWHIITRLL